MKHFFGVALALGASILLAVTNAGRLADVAQRRGYTKQLIERSSSRMRARQVVNSTEYRFYSNTTARELAMASMSTVQS